MSALSAAHATLISALITSIYVGGLYILPSARLSFAKTSREGVVDWERNQRWRDDNQVIKGRLKAAILSTCLSCGIIYACVLNGSGSHASWKTSIIPSLHLLGLKSPSLNLKSLAPHFLTPVLYIGPLTAHFLSGTLPLQRNWSYQGNLRPLFATWIGMRNYVVAPLTEELVFRSCLLALADMSRRGTYHKIFVTPLWFGIAHLHHSYEIYNRFGRTRPALIRAVMTCMVQATYTTLFGAFTAFLLLRTTSVLAPITAHATANILGLPQPGHEIRQHHNHRLLIYMAYVTGIIGFVCFLGSGII